MNKLIVTMFTSIILFGCGEKAENTTSTQDNGHALSLNAEQFHQLGIATALLSTDTIFGELSIQGMITVPTQQKQSISFPVAAKLESLSIQLGQTIEKNQIVAWVSDLSFIQLQEDYLKSLLQTELAEREFTRQQELMAKNATSDKAFQESKNQYLLFNTQRQALVQRLALLDIALPKDGTDIQRKVSIRAEQSGKIVSCNVQPGQYLSAGQELATIMNTEPLWVDAALYHATDIQQIRNDRVALKDNQGHEGVGKIIHKGGEISNSDQAAHLWISVEQSTGEWMPGMPVDCKLSLDKINVYQAEKDAIVQFANQSQIFVTADNSNFDMVPVQLIKESGGWQYFTTSAPLSSDQKMVSKGAYYLLMALKNKSE